MKTYLANEDYNRALKQYLKQYPEKKNDPVLNMSIGVCYLNINDDRSKAIPYLEFVYKTGKYSNDIFLYLGMAYMYNYEFDKAIDYFNDYKLKVGSKEAIVADLLIDNCENAKVLVKKPVNVTFENLGKEINTVSPDYYPFVTKDEGTLYFTTRRDATVGNVQSWQGYYTSDIYYSKVQNGQWTKARNAGPLFNSQEDEQCVYISSDAKIMIVYEDNLKVSGDLFITSTSNKAKNFQKPVLIPDPVSTGDTEFEACINDEGNILIFNSDRPGGFGGMDLYMSKKLPNGQWGKSVNLGSEVNSQYNEGFPVYDEQNNVLYFASEGHFNMGGYDIFKSKFNVKSQKFENPVNIGYPINTPEDNMQFSLAGNKRDGYISAYRKEGYGDLDIYKVVFNDVDKPITAFKGLVSTNDSLLKDLNATVKVIDAKTNEEVESKTINPKTRKFVFALEPGKYILTIDAEGFEPFKEEFGILDKVDFVSSKEKQFLLLRQGIAIPLGQAKGENKPQGVSPKKK